MNFIAIAYRAVSAHLSRWIRDPWKGMGIITALTLLAYSNMFHNPFFMDDFDFIVDWPLIQDWANWPRFFIGYVTPDGQEGVFSPFKTLLHALNYRLFGLNPFGHHVFAFAGYVAGVGIVYWLSLFFLRDRFAGFLSALLFALHPVHIEYVSSMTGGVDAVGVVLLFIAFSFYVRIDRADGRMNGGMYGWSLLFAFLSIYLHELCITLPVMFLWYDVCFRRGRGSVLQTLRRIGPFFLLSALYVLAKYLTLGTITRGHYVYGSFYLTMLIAIKAMAKYVFISVFPVTLTFNHVISDGIFSFSQEDFDRAAVLSQSFLEPQVMIALGVLGGLGYWAFKTYRNFPLATFCIGWFFIGLLPGANIVPSGVYFAERYLYPGSWGLCLLFGHFMNRVFLSRKTIGRVRCAVLARAIVIFIVLFCMGRIWVRNWDGRSEAALYESAVRANPRSALMRTDLGLVYARHQLYDQAIASFQEALKIRTDDPDIYFAMGNTYLDTRQYTQALEAFQEAVALNPKSAAAHYNLAGIYMKLGQRLKAQAHLEQALSFYREERGEDEARAWEKAFWDYFRPLKGAP